MKAGTTLTTSLFTASAFVPTAATQWRNEVVALPAGASNNASVLVRFTATSDYGNNLYIDNVNLGAIPTSIKALATTDFNVSLYPNPSADFTNLNVTTKAATTGKVFVYNTVGQLVFEKAIALTEGANNIVIDTKNFSSGVYNVVLSSSNGSTVKKLTVNK